MAFDRENLTKTPPAGRVDAMRWSKISEGGQVLVDEHGRSLGRVRLIGGQLGRWVALGAESQRADVIGWYTTVDEARRALEKNVLGKIQGENEK